MKNKCPPAFCPFFRGLHPLVCHAMNGDSVGDNCIFFAVCKRQRSSVVEAAGAAEGWPVGDVTWTGTLMPDRSTRFLTRGRARGRGRVRGQRGAARGGFWSGTSRRTNYGGTAKTP